jgi:hypothetical protein
MIRFETEWPVADGPSTGLNHVATTCAKVQAHEVQAHEYQTSCPVLHLAQVRTIGNLPSRVFARMAAARLTPRANRRYAERCRGATVRVQMRRLKSSRSAGTYCPFTPPSTTVSTSHVISHPAPCSASWSSPKACRIDGKLVVPRIRETLNATSVTKRSRHA